MGLFTKFFGTRSQREIKQIQPIVNKVLALENEYKYLSEDALKAKTAEFKNRLAVLEDLVLHIVSHSAPELIELLRPRFPNELQAARAARPGPCFVNKPVLVGRFCGRGTPDKRAVILTVKAPIIGIKIAASHATPPADISAAPAIDQFDSDIYRVMPILLQGLRFAALLAGQRYGIGTRSA